MKTVEKLTLAEFRALQAKRTRKQSWQAAAMEEMNVETALRINHEGISHAKTGCGFKYIRRRLEAKHPDRSYTVAHDKEGNALVACYGRKQ